MAFLRQSVTIRKNRKQAFYHFAELCINRQLYSALQASNRKKHQPLNTYISFSSGESDDGVKVEDALLGQSQSPEQLVIEKEVWEDFKQRLNGRLSKMENQVLAFYLDGNNYIQIAQLMNKSPKSIDNALQRIRQKSKTDETGRKRVRLCSFQESENIQFAV